MKTKAVRVFYRKSNNQIVWSHELRIPFEGYPGEFPTTMEQDLAEIPNKAIITGIDGEGEPILTKLGGIPKDYAGIEETNSQRAKDFLNSDKNTIVDGALVIGAKRII